MTMNNSFIKAASFLLISCFAPQALHGMMVQVAPEPIHREIIAICKSGQGANLNELIIHNDDFRWKAQNGETFLHTAVAAGNVSVLKALMARGLIDINSKTFLEGNTPLHLAAEAGNLEMVEALLSSKKISINELNIFGETPLYRARFRSHADLARFLMNHGATDPKTARIRIHTISEKKSPNLGEQQKKIDSVPASVSSKPGPAIEAASAAAANVQGVNAATQKESREKRLACFGALASKTQEPIKSVDPVNGAASAAAAASAQEGIADATMQKESRKKRGAFLDQLYGSITTSTQFNEPLRLYVNKHTKHNGNIQARIDELNARHVWSACGVAHNFFKHMSLGTRIATSACRQLVQKVMTFSIFGRKTITF